ncbi:PBECR3 domain-containing polyvalent protein, partial [Helicobacter bizzozeronii]|uniref:PBECR3 domain-containing polyvalent protein n=1 Tax=Helicobacter bizzozeronii TaxID=56877 RepID=UPI00131549E9
MKESLKIIDKGALKLRDVARSEQRALDALIKYTQGQGAEGLDNLSRITKGLSPANREVLELNMLNRLFANSLEQLEGLKVFDSQAFFKHLDSLKEGTFQSKAAQDFIEIASGFNRLFNQDAKLAKALKSTTGEHVGSSIATSVWGAVQYQITKFAFALMVRTMPFVPFFKGINSKVSAAALRYHIKAALNKSASVQDFKIQLNHLVQRQDFDNATKALIREIEGGLPPDDPPPSGGGGGGGIANPHLGDSGGKPPRGGDDLLDPSKPLRRANIEEITQEFLEEVKKRNVKVWIGDFTPQEKGLMQELGFDSKYPVKITFNGDALKHVEKNHGLNSIHHIKNEQPAIGIEDIKYYPQVVNESDISKVIDNKDGQKLLASAKQINGYFMVIETISTKKNELKLKTLYKENGEWGKNPIFGGMGERPKNGEDSLSPQPSVNLDARPQTTSPNPTTPELKNQATKLHAKAKEQEAGFKQLLESLSQPSSTLEASNILKSVGSIQSKLERKQGRVESLNDLLRGAIISRDRETIDDQLVQIAIKLRDAQIPHTIEYKENRGSGYEGIHIHFKHNDVPAEIQVHTPKNWAIKKKQDESYHVTRDNEITKKLSETQVKELLQKSKALGQESDLDISLLTSFEVISTEFSGSAMSVNLKNAATDSNLTHILRLKSNSKEPPPSKDANAYKRPDSELNQNDNLSSGSGNNIAPLNQLPQNTTTPQT